jgi:hypothetical protein
MIKFAFTSVCCLGWYGTLTSTLSLAVNPDNKFDSLEVEKFAG